MNGNVASHVGRNRTGAAVSGSAGRDREDRPTRCHLRPNTSRDPSPRQRVPTRLAARRPTSLRRRPCRTERLQIARHQQLRPDGFGHASVCGTHCSASPYRSARRRCHVPDGGTRIISIHSPAPPRTACEHQLALIAATRSTCGRGPSANVRARLRTRSSYESGRCRDLAIRNHQSGAPADPRGDRPEVVGRNHVDRHRINVACTTERSSNGRSSRHSLGNRPAESTARYTRRRVLRLQTADALQGRRDVESARSNNN